MHTHVRMYVQYTPDYPNNTDFRIIRIICINTRFSLRCHNLYTCVSIVKDSGSFSLAGLQKAVYLQNKS